MSNPSTGRARELEWRFFNGFATTEDFKALSDQSLRDLRTANVVHRRCSFREVDSQPDRTVRHRASTEDRDAMGDIIRVAGWNIGRVKSGVAPLLYAHDSGKGGGDDAALPVGKIMRAEKGYSNATGERALLTYSRFHDIDTFADAPQGRLAEAVFRMVDIGALPGSSVGFIPDPEGIYVPANAEERKELGLGPWGVDYREGHELLENSVVPVPANAGALVERSMHSRKQLVQALEYEARRDLIEAVGAIPITDEEARKAERAARRSTVQVDGTRDDSWMETVEAPEQKGAEVKLRVSDEGVVQTLTAFAGALESLSKQVERVQAALDGKHSPPERTRDGHGQVADPAGSRRRAPKPSRRNHADDRQALNRAVIEHLAGKKPGRIQ